ncbi:endonuclease domain-containing protein [Bizionia sp. M204]|uniref:endonuclease domain-containing protein n=1 Tax=Bizionia sp. M204 TaxID=2675331 RepID=UPI00206332E1|nr:endonuclease domain-containing protein [Bizionia sp. M204]UPS91688.1 DUF559 domain-containing protein [Bizionia sp. M204]
MSKQKIHTKKELQAYRKKLRKTLTPAEAYLWKHIKSRQLNNKRFTKQHSIGHYIVDFYCASEKLVIELDGEVHFNPMTQEYDKKRTVYLESLGYKVIRFENKMVFDHLPSVLQEIKECFNSGEEEEEDKPSV